MSIFTKILDRFGIAAKRDVKNMARWQAETADAQQWTLPDPYIFANQADMYRLDPNLGTVLDMFSEDIGMAKFNVKRRSGENIIDISNHEFEVLMNNPNPLDTGLELIANTVTDYKLNGNATWWLSRQSWSDKPKEIWYIPFHQLRPVPNGRLYLSHYKYNPGNGRQEIDLPTWQVVHFRSRNPFNRFIGLSPLESLADTLAADLGMRKTQRTTYAQRNGEPPSILAFKEYINNEAWKDLQDKIKASAEENKMMTLRGSGDGVTWMSRALSNREQDIIGLYQQYRIEIWDRLVPGAATMLDGGANRSTADAARATYSESLWRMMSVIARKITKEILNAYTWGDKLYGEYDDPRFVDRQIRIQEIQEYAKYHVLDEVRKKQYNSESIGDERGDLLVSQIKSESVKDVEVETFTEPQEQETMDNPEQEQDANKAAVSALYKWKKQVKNGRTEKANLFYDPAIPHDVARVIKARLPVLQTDAALKMFDRYITRLQTTPIDPRLLMRGLIAAIEKQEK